MLDINAICDEVSLNYTSANSFVLTMEAVQTGGGRRDILSQKDKSPPKKLKKIEAIANHIITVEEPLSLVANPIHETSLDAQPAPIKRARKTRKDVTAKRENANSSCLPSRDDAEDMLELKVSEHHPNNSELDDLLEPDNHLTNVIDGGGHFALDPQHRVASPDYIIQLVQLWRVRQQWHRSEKSLSLQAQAICRRYCDGDKDKAGALFKSVLKDGADNAILEMALAPYIESMKGFEKLRGSIEKHLKQLAKQNPAYGFIKSIRGFGELNFAALLGELGDDILAYKSPSAVWKRMGLAVLDGERQRKCTDADKALIHGYNPSRRSVAYLISECLLRGGDEKYRAMYLARKEYELNRHLQNSGEEEGHISIDNHTHFANLSPDEGGQGYAENQPPPSPLKPLTPIHAHRRAMRYMVKKCLRDVWVARRSAQ
jgi:hypothetical protein